MAGQQSKTIEPLIVIISTSSAELNSGHNNGWHVPHGVKLYAQWYERALWIALAPTHVVMAKYS